MRKKKDIEVVIHKDIEKEMKKIADNIFGYNPKIPHPVVNFILFSPPPRATMGTDFFKGSC